MNNFAINVFAYDEKFQIYPIRISKQSFTRTQIDMLYITVGSGKSQYAWIKSLWRRWYYTAPGLSWDSMLKFTGVEIELLTDYEQLLFVEKGIREGISQCSVKYAKANNKYMKTFDATKPDSYLIYLDANNLYGHSQSQSLPLRHFQWCDSNIDLMSIPDDSQTGYILEVSLEYSIDLHDSHNDYPLAATRQISPKCREERLLLTLEDKEKYIIHYKNLQFYIQQGLKLKKIHRVLKFHQEPFLKPYIDHNTALRTAASNAFEKDFYKLMNNSIFGKYMEDIRRRKDIRLCCKNRQAEKLIAKPNFMDRIIFNENLSAIQLGKTEIYFNKPISIGMAILDLSKICLMADFHYNYTKVQYRDRAQLLYTDTDSFIYHIFTPNIYEDMKANLSRFDTSDYPSNNPYGMPQVNKKVIGLFKDECSGRIMTEFVGVRSKVYSYITEDGDTCKKLKGIQKFALKQKITFEDYKRCIQESAVIYTTMNTFRNKNHDITSVTQNKLALVSCDEKRFTAEDGVNTYAWGHYRICEQ